MPSRSLLLCTPELSDAATITGSATVGTMTIANLQKIQPTDTCRFASLGDQAIVIDLGGAGAAYHLNTIWLGFHNGTSAGTLRVRSASSQANLTNGLALYDETFGLWPAGADLSKWKRRHTLIRIDDEENPDLRWWRLDAADASNPDGFFEAGRLYLSNAFEPAWGIQYGARFGTLEEPRRRKTQGGQVHPIPQPRQAIAEVTCRLKTKDEAYLKAQEIGRLRGTSDDVLLVYAPQEPQYLQQRTAYGVLSEATVVTLESYAYHTTSFRVEELP